MTEGTVFIHYAQRKIMTDPKELAEEFVENNFDPHESGNEEDLIHKAFLSGWNAAVDAAYEEVMKLSEDTNHLNLPLIPMKNGCVYYSARRVLELRTKE